MRNTRIQFDSAHISKCVCVNALNYSSAVCVCVIARAAERGLLVKTFKSSSLESCWYRAMFY